MNEKKFILQAAVTFGLEAVAKREAARIGFDQIRASDGYVEFKASSEDIVKANLNFRCVDRIMLVLKRFKALDFEELFEGVYSVDWCDILPENAQFIVTGKSIKSLLSSVPAIQSVSEKAIIKKLQTKYARDNFSKDGARYIIQIGLLKDEVTVLLNTSGPSLHKRGYRTDQGLAPLKETMAAALIELSFWKNERIFLDPCCGSGTIPIEAALIARNIAPGLYRHFDFEKQGIIDANIVKQEKVNARSAIDFNVTPKIYGSDINKRAIEMSLKNSSNAGVDDCIVFEQIPFNKLVLPGDYGVCVSNPPYGERMGESSDVERLYRDMGRLFGKNNTWSAYILTSNESFEKFYGKRADKKRKLFNGNVKVDYYQFFGQKPTSK